MFENKNYCLKIPLKADNLLRHIYIAYSPAYTANYQQSMNCDIYVAGCAGEKLSVWLPPAMR